MLIMAYSTVKLQNGFGVIKEAPVGYSWTMLFFGIFVPLLRGDWKWAAITLLAAIFSYGLVPLIIFPFIYNKFYLKDLIYKGYKVKGEIPNIQQIEAYAGMEIPRV